MPHHPVQLAAQPSQVYDLMTLCFRGDPPTRWMWPDTGQYLEWFPRFAAAYAGAAFDHGGVDIMEGGKACAMWLPPGVHSDDDQIEAIIHESVPTERHKEVSQLIAEMDAFKPKHPVSALMLIAVDPTVQGRGLGSALLTQHLARCDDHGVTAYLDIRTPRPLTAAIKTLPRLSIPAWAIRLVSTGRWDGQNKGSSNMRVLVMVKATAESERGFNPTPEVMAMMKEMGRFNDDLRAAGIFVMADGLAASSEGKRVAFDGLRRTVIDGPFAPPSELVAGFWLWDVKDMEEAVAWVKRCPNPMSGPSEIEIRPIQEIADMLPT